MSATLDYQMADHLHRFRAAGAGKEARIPVLLNMILHKNNRNRVWIAPETIAEETGIGRARIIQAEKWLAEHGAIFIVPPEHRAGEEAKLHPNKNVWQITGLLNADGVVFPYLYIRDEARAEMLAEMQKIAPDEIVKLFIETENSGTEIEPKEGAKLSTEVELKTDVIRTENRGDLDTENVRLHYTEQGSDQKITMDHSSPSRAGAAGERAEPASRQGKNGGDDAVAVKDNGLEIILTELRRAGVNVNERVRQLAAGWGSEEIERLIARSHDQRGLDNTPGWIVSQMREPGTLDNIRAEIAEESEADEILPQYDAHIRAWRGHLREQMIERQTATAEYVARQRAEFLGSATQNTKTNAPSAIETSIVPEAHKLEPGEIWEAAQQRVILFELAERDKPLVEGLKYAGAANGVIYVRGDQVRKPIWGTLRHWVSVRSKGEWSLSKLARGEEVPAHEKRMVLVGRQNGRDAEPEIKTAFEIAPGVMVIPPGAPPPPDPLPNHGGEETTELEERVQARIDKLNSELLKGIMEIRQ